MAVVHTQMKNEESRRDFFTDFGDSDVKMQILVAHEDKSSWKKYDVQRNKIFQINLNRQLI